MFRPIYPFVRSRQMVLSSSLNTLNTFFPNRKLFTEAARSLGVSSEQDKTAPKRIYLSRSNQQTYSQRWVKNENQVQEALRKRGFVIIEPGNLPFQEQARAFANADIILGAHGSSFGNLVFAKTGATVIDMMPNHWIEYWGAGGIAERWLLNLTTALDLNYHLVMCNSSAVEVLPANDSSGLQKTGMASTVNIDLLMAAVDAAQ
jgi:capsular polysaccharide biosynthesis protein